MSNLIRVRLSEYYLDLLKKYRIILLADLFRGDLFISEKLITYSFEVSDNEMEKLKKYSGLTGLNYSQIIKVLLDDISFNIDMQNMHEENTEDISD